MPSSRNSISFGVDLGAFRIPLRSIRSTVSISSNSALVILYHASLLNRTLLTNMLFLKMIPASKWYFPNGIPSRIVKIFLTIPVPLFTLDCMFFMFLPSLYITSPRYFSSLFSSMTSSLSQLSSILILPVSQSSTSYSSHLSTYNG